MRPILSERNIVVVLFVMVFITFSLAHEDTKKMEQIYHGVNSSATVVLQEWAEKENIRQDKTPAVVLPSAFKN